MTQSVLEKNFNPQGWQWQENGRVYQLEDLSREDLLQVACRCMAVLERLDEQHQAAAAIHSAWRYGTPLPPEDPDNG